jgi:hypothetical protein
VIVKMLGICRNELGVIQGTRMSWSIGIVEGVLAGPCMVQHCLGNSAPVDPVPWFNRPKMKGISGADSTRHYCIVEN